MISWIHLTLAGKEITNKPETNDETIEFAAMRAFSSELRFIVHEFDEDMQRFMMMIIDNGRPSLQESLNTLITPYSRLLSPLLPLLKYCRFYPLIDPFKQNAIKSSLGKGSIMIPQNIFIPSYLTSIISQGQNLHRLPFRTKRQWSTEDVYQRIWQIFISTIKAAIDAQTFILFVKDLITLIKKDEDQSILRKIVLEEQQEERLQRVNALIHAHQIDITKQEIQQEELLRRLEEQKALKESKLLQIQKAAEQKDLHQQIKQLNKRIKA
ncbi:MAG: hypothetical protein EZS28_012662 [Streblomastix strix]|uniref:Uncharacterized protein n=1 Tax=Streblomastix strix TaxID=222440 RepID=A0A5J4WAX7_9EUKA|nr:MAG: hypothetical protein EZS28_012662 [Streblomastix strix]